jgi:hypothetical protein
VLTVTGPLHGLYIVFSPNYIKSGFQFLGCLLLDCFDSFTNIHGTSLIQVKIYVNASRRRILLAYDCPDYSDRLCTNGKDTLLHVLPMSSLRIEVKFCANTFYSQKSLFFLYYFYSVISLTTIYVFLH